MGITWARVRPLVLRTIIGAVVAAGLVGVVGVLLGDFGVVAVQLLLTILVVVVFALLSWYDADVSSRRSGLFAGISVAVSLYLLVTGFIKVWIVPADRYTGHVEGWNVGEAFWQWVVLVFIARGALLHVHLLLIILRRYPTPVLQLVAKATVGVIVVLGVLLSIPVLWAHTHFADGYWRLVWVVVILDLLGTVIVPLSNALFGPRHPRVPRPYPAGTYFQQPAFQPPAFEPPAFEQPAFQQPVHPPVATATSPAVPAADWSSAPTVDGDEQPVHEQAAHERPIGAQEGPVPDAAAAYVYEPPPGPARVLAWPRYVDGSPLPANPDGTPDFSGAQRRV
jgi:hypothetical protein